MEKIKQSPGKGVSKEFFIQKAMNSSCGELTNYHKNLIRAFFKNNYNPEKRNKISVCKDIQQELNLRFREVYDYVTLVLNEEFKVPIRRYKKQQLMNSKQHNQSEEDSYHLESKLQKRADKESRKIKQEITKSKNQDKLNSSCDSLDKKVDYYILKYKNQKKDNPP